MANVYIAKDGDRFDNIVYEHYGNTDFINKVLDSNQHLVGKLVLELGDKVVLPKIEEVFKPNEGKALW